MLARIQKLLAVALLALALSWAAVFVHLGLSMWAWVGALTILLGYTLFLGAEFVILFFVQRGEPALRPSAMQILRAWWGEVLTTPKVFLWRQPFRPNAEPDHLPARAAGGQTGVVLVHGFFCNRGLWTPWMRELRAGQVPFVAVNLEPVLGSIDHYPQVIETAVLRMEAATGLPVVLVGHSMGGLAIRAWLAKFDADARVRRVITIGSPHHGTWLGRFGHTANGKQMRLASPWLTRLAAQETVSRRARFTCFYGHCDNIVFPAATGMLADAENRHLPGTAHVHMAFEPVVFNELGRWLGSGAEPALAPRGPATVAQ